MTDLISVIVPIYKVEAYLDKCVESIVNQTYRNLEIILVDDGSPDKCPEMCDTWAKKDSRIKVIHKPNGGLSDARNAGMEIASGEYIAFVDSDDFVDKHYAEFLHKAIIENKVKMSACDYILFYEQDSVAEDIYFGNVCVSSSEEAIGDILNNRKVRAVAWNKMYHKDLLKNEHFPVGKFHEDEFFTYRIIHKAENLAYVESKLYYYLQRQGSIMSSFNIKHLDAMDAGLERLDFLKKNYSALYLHDKGTFCVSCVQLYREALKHPGEDTNLIKGIIKSKRKQVRVKLGELKNYSTKTCAYIIGGRYFIGLFSLILNKFERKNND